MRVSEKLWYAGFDIETTGLNPNHHGMIELGLMLDPRVDVWQSYVYPGIVEYSAEALEVNGQTKNTIAKFPSMRAVEDKFLVMAEEVGLQKRQIVPIGFNVGSFDMQFLRKQSPLIASYFSHRSVDLNSVVYTLDPLQAWNLKERLSAEVAEQMGEDRAFHTAAYDARFAYNFWRALQFWQNGKGLHDYLTTQESKGTSLVDPS